MIASIAEPKYERGNPRVGARALADAKASLRRQIDRLERQLGALAFELGCPGRAQPLPREPQGARLSAPRLLSLAELESVRDRLFTRVRLAEDALSDHIDGECRARRHLEAMLAEPRAHRFEAIHRADLGEGGCGAYEVRPRLGLLGMLFDWWCVKLSSGCP